jgi:hypothetical protein
MSAEPADLAALRLELADLGEGALQALLDAAAVRVRLILVGFGVDYDDLDEDDEDWPLELREQLILHMAAHSSTYLVPYLVRESSAMGDSAEIVARPATGWKATPWGEAFEEMLISKFGHTFKVARG